MVWSGYRDTNLASTSPLADDIATAPSGQVPRSVLACIYCQRQTHTSGLAEYQYKAEGKWRAVCVFGVGGGEGYFFIVMYHCYL